MYYNLDDFIAGEITPALSEYEGDFDMYGAAGEMCTWHSYDDGQGGLYVDPRAIVLRPELVDNPDLFWEIIARYEYEQSAPTEEQSAPTEEQSAPTEEQSAPTES